MPSDTTTNDSRLPSPTHIFAREIDDLAQQVKYEPVEQSVSAASYHDGYLDALKKVQELVDVYGLRR